MKFDLHALLTAKCAQWIIIILISLFSLLIVAKWSTLFFSDENSQFSSEKVNEIHPEAEHNTFDAILPSSLFGAYVSNNLSSVKKSILNVTLVGILFADTMNDSQVIIRSANGEERNYKIGDTVPGGALIKRIMATGVVVDRRGNLESLSLPERKLIFEPVAKPLPEDKDL